MSIVVDPNAIKAQSASSKPKSFGVDDFSATMSAIAPGASEAMFQAQGYDSAAVTHAAITGVAGAAGSYGYGSVYGNPLVGAAGGASGLVGAAVTGGDAIPGFTPTGGTTGTGGASQSFLEGQALIQTMNDSNMRMLVLQSQVQDVNREYTVLSNVLQSKHQTERNAIQNMKI